MRTGALFLILLLLSQTSLFAQKKGEREIKALLDRQTLAWNNGDIQTFMQDYWKSEELKFIGKSGVERGWEATYQRYLRTYTDKATMGTLKFDHLEIDLINKKTAWVLGSWHLTRPEKGDIGGYFTLMFKKIGKEWKIVSDHTS